MKRKFVNNLIYLIIFTPLLLTAQKFTKQPYLANPTASSITIRWESDSKNIFTVEFGLKKILNEKVTAKFLSKKESGYLYEATINNIETGNKYFYRVISQNSNSKISTFKIGVKPNSDYSVVVLGDSRSKPDVFKSIAERVNKIDPLAIIATGDLVANGGNLNHWQKQFFDASNEMINHIPFLSAVGDHESDSVDGDSARLFTHFLFPLKDNSKLWFSYDIGTAHYIFLDWRTPNSNEMIDWFRNDVKQSKALWKFVVMHRPTYNLGGHHTAWGKNIWPQIFRENKIDIVFAGHSHLYERFFPVKLMSEPDSWAVTYITTGGAGASLYEAIEHPMLAYTKSINHFLKVSFKGNNIKIETLGIDGSLLDSVSWSKKNGNICSEYIATSKPQEELDIINIFNEPISQRMAKLPMVEVPYAPILRLNANGISEDIEFTIRLDDKSLKNYKMDSISGTLKSSKSINVQLNIFGKSTMTVTRWGDLAPELRLIAEFKTKSISGKVIGKRLEYIAW